MRPCVLYCPLAVLYCPLAVLDCPLAVLDCLLVPSLLIALASTLRSNAGSTANLVYSLAYAPPEVVAASAAGERSITAAASADMWAIGVIAYELLSGQPAFPPGTSQSAIADALVGKRKLPWEAASSRQLRMLLKLKGPVLQCLSRDPELRPTIDQLMANLFSIFQAATTGAPLQPESASSSQPEPSTPAQGSTQSVAGVTRSTDAGTTSVPVATPEAFTDYTINLPALPEGAPAPPAAAAPVDGSPLRPATRLAAADQTVNAPGLPRDAPSAPVHDAAKPAALGSPVLVSSPAAADRSATGALGSPVLLGIPAAADGPAAV